MFKTPPRILAAAFAACLCMTFPLELRAGDFDGNTVVESSDQAVFQMILLGQSTDPAYMAIADVNHDGKVDGRDIGPFTMMMQLGGAPAGGAPGQNRGACCISTPGNVAICVVIPEHACANHGGTFYGAGTRCTDPNVGCPIMPTPIVACCLPDGTCVNARPVPCVQMMGVPQGPFTNCANHGCTTPPPVGACCVSFFGLPANACFETTQDRCDADGGQYQGDGTQCGDPNLPCTPPPPPTGACCFSDGSCQDLTFIDCIQNGGQPKPPMTSCNAADACVPPTLGACCVNPPFGPSFCLQTTAAECAQLQGAYQGDNSNCQTTGCTSTDTGACCIPTPGPQGGGQIICIETTDFNCADSHGIYQGDGTSCDDANIQCPPVRTGACCINAGGAIGTCIETTPFDCQEIGGVYRGDDSNCQTPGICGNDVLGRCCFQGIVPFPVLCDVTTQAACFQFGGPVSWTPGENCDGDPCNDGEQVGACCVQNSPGGPAICIVTTPQQCQASSGLYQGDGTDCTSDTPCSPPALGACCVSFIDPVGGGSHCIVTNEALCTEQLGQYLGDGTTCDMPNIPCPNAPRGACCLGPTGGQNGGCLETTAANCNLHGGAYQGDNTTCNTPGICGDPQLGRCCFQGFVPFPILCEVTTQAACFQFAAPVSWTPGETCEGDPCNEGHDVGACCLGNIGGVEGCTIVSASECAELGGDYLGDGTVCAFGGCAPPTTGACCLTNSPTVPPSGCIDTTPQDCAAIGGDYQGDGTSCTDTDDICPPPVIGACCVSTIDPNGGGLVCIDTDPARCEELGGDYQGDGSGCDQANLPCPPPPTGACCVEIFGAPINCIETTPIECTLHGGSYNGDGTTCQTPGICDNGVLGRCCFLGAIPEPALCAVLTQAECFANTVPVSWTAGEDCEGDPCNTTDRGACCLPPSPISPPGNCLELTPEGCAEAGGDYQGDGSSCLDPNVNCVAPITGACCFPFGIPGGNNSCSETTEAQCIQGGGDYQGDNTSCNTAGICDNGVLGRCCFLGIVPEPALCAVLTQAECFANTVPVSWTAGEDCEGDPCNTTDRGACCLPPSPISPPGNCLELTPEGCAEAGGDYQGDNTSCNTAGICDNGLLGRCCFLGIVPEPVICAVMTRFECLSQTGTVSWTPGEDCEGDPCNAPTTGACCVSLAIPENCIEVSAEECEAAGGVYRGDGTSCDTPGICNNNVLGRCCFRGAIANPVLCDVTTQAACFQLPAPVSWTPGENCDGDPCNDVTPVGACCLSHPIIGGGGNCIEVTAAQCEQFGGDYQGDSSRCIDVNCPPFEPRGACCSDLFLNPLGCIEMTAAQCEKASGTYQGDGTVCGPNVCSTDEIGACCLFPPFGPFFCIETTIEDCESQGGDFAGVGTTCNGSTLDCQPPTGACCAHVFNAQDCMVMTLHECLNIGGQYQGDGTTCEDDTTDCRSVCCLPDGTCELLESIECILSGGIPDFAAEDCSQAICVFEARGACCITPALGPFICFETTEADCAQQNGTYGGDNSTCTNNACPPQLRGACCIQNGSQDPSCVEVTAAQCAMAQGQYQGDGTHCSDAGIPCSVQAQGACCVQISIPGGGCFDTTADMCAMVGGNYLGDNTSCLNTLCPTPVTGACCILGPGGPFFCVETSADGCAANGGIYAGDGTTCSDANLECPGNSGACCVPDAPNGPRCIDADQATCATLGGIFQGPLTSCGNSPICGG